MALFLLLSCSGEPSKREIVQANTKNYSFQGQENTLKFTEKDHYFQVKADSGDPEPGVAWTFSGRFSLRRLPPTSSKVILCGKYNVSSSSGKGFALALVREAHQLRPAVYWSTKKQPGHWLFFRELSTIAKAWISLSITLDKNGVISLYGGNDIAEGSGFRSKFNHLGSHLTNSSFVPATSASLICGARDKNDFIGKIGRWGILKGSEGVMPQSVFDALEGGKFCSTSLSKNCISYGIRDWSSVSLNNASDIEFSFEVPESEEPKKRPKRKKG